MIFFDGGAFPLDLSTFGGGVDSPDEDWIQLSLRFVAPRTVESLQITFITDDIAKMNDTFTKEITIDTRVDKKRLRGERKKGIADIPQVSNNEQTFLTSVNASTPFNLKAAEILGEDAFHAEDDVWCTLKLPKSSFVKNGEASWATIVALKMVVRTNERALLAGLPDNGYYLDDIKLVGGVGMQGTYQWKYTYKNSATGTRSNPSPASTALADLTRQGATVTVQNSSDLQVDLIELWRTLGNGEEFFFDQQIANGGGAVFTDTTADYKGLHSLATNTEILGTDVLPTDNLPPASTYEDAEGLHYGRVFWCRDRTPGASGRVYYSPAARAEAVSGFIDATDDDDQTQRLVRWNGSLYCFTERRIVEIAGSDEPFLARPIAHAPGTSWPFTVVPTAEGIYYRATDGLRIFNGQSSEVISFGLGNIAQGETVEDFAGFAPTFACDSPLGEVWFCEPGGKTLAYLPEAPRWRQVGIATNAVFYERETGRFLGSRTVGAAGDILSLEVEASTSTDPVDFEIETAHRRVDSAVEALVQWVFIDINTGGATLTPTLLLDGVARTLPDITSSSRRLFEIPVNRPARQVGLRLTGTLTVPIEVFGLEAEVTLPEGAMVAPPASQR
jgi:hypothetical protein